MKLESGTSKSLALAVQRANGICEHCNRPLAALEYRCDTYPCYKCGKRTTVKYSDAEEEDEWIEDGPGSRYEDFSYMAERTYPMFHCDHCGAKLGDWYIRLHFLDNREEFYPIRFHFHIYCKNGIETDHRLENLLIVHPECRRKIATPK